MKRSRSAAWFLVAAACAAAPERAQPGQPDAPQRARLKAAEAAYRAGAPELPTLRGEVAADPVTAAWYTRMLVRDILAAREGRPLGEDAEFLRAAAGIDDPTTARAVAELRALGAAALPTLVGDLLQHDQPQPRELGVELLAELGPTARAALTPVARDGAVRQRRAAIRALGRIGFDADGFALAQAMARGDGDFTVRADALRSLRGGGPAAQALLIERLQGDRDAYVRRVAAETLAGFPSTASATALVDYLAACENAADDDGRRAAQRALGEMAGVRGARTVADWRAWAAGVDARAAAKSGATPR